jgi:hypothetical protein
MVSITASCAIVVVACFLNRFELILNTLTVGAKTALAKPYKSMSYLFWFSFFLQKKIKLRLL